MQFDYLAVEFAGSSGRATRLIFTPFRCFINLGTHYTGVILGKQVLLSYSSVLVNNYDSWISFSEHIWLIKMYALVEIMLKS